MSTLLNSAFYNFLKSENMLMLQRNSDYNHSPEWKSNSQLPRLLSYAVQLRNDDLKSKRSTILKY